MADFEKPKTLSELTIEEYRQLSYYERLDISQKATNDEIEIAYKKLVKSFHPDLVADPKLKEIKTEMFKMLLEAKFILQDPNKRRSYDLSGAWKRTKKPSEDSFKGTKSQQHGYYQEQSKSKRKPNDFDFGDFEFEFKDYFNEIFKNKIKNQENIIKKEIYDILGKENNKIKGYENIFDSIIGNLEKNNIKK